MDKVSIAKADFPGAEFRVAKIDFSIGKGTSEESHLAARERGTMKTNSATGKIKKP